MIGSGNFLWAVGGKLEFFRAIDDVSVYNIDQNRWYSSSRGELTPMPHAVQGAGWTVYQNQIFCFGGKTKYHSGCTDLVQVYDIQSNQWELLEKMPSCRSKLAKHYPVVNQNYIYLFGGDCAEGQYFRVNWNWKFNLKTYQWDTSPADAPHVQSFPLATEHNGWLYYSTGNMMQGPIHSFPGAINQRYHPEEDCWEEMAPCPIPVTDGEGDKYQGELHFLGGWNANPRYYNRFRPKRFKGRVKKLHLVYNYELDQWRLEDMLPGSWHHGGAKAAQGYLWRYLGSIDEEMSLATKTFRFSPAKKFRVAQHTNKIFRWDGDLWQELQPAPVRKINFGTLYTKLGPIG